MKDSQRKAIHAHSKRINHLDNRIGQYQEARKLLNRHYVQQGNKRTPDQMNHLESINHELPYMRTEIENLKSDPKGIKYKVRTNMKDSHPFKVTKQ